MTSTQKYQKSNLYRSAADFYHGSLLEKICDKLEIDYSDAKQRAIESEAHNQNLRQTKLKDLDAERSKISSRLQASQQDSEARVMSRQLEKELQDAEEKRLSELSPDEIEELKAAYCAASDEADKAMYERFQALDNSMLSALDRDQLKEKHERLRRKANNLRDNLKFATTGMHSRNSWF